MDATFSVGASAYTISGTVGRPAAYEEMIQRAKLHDDRGLNSVEGTPLVVSVSESVNWPALVISLRFDPGPEAGFSPGALIVPETRTLFLGAGSQILAYDLSAPKRLWEDEADTGFWCWCRHDDFVLMSAELELAAWDLQGTKQWSTFVEPPWSYEVRGGRVHLDIMGKKSAFPIVDGPPAGPG